MSPVVKTSNEKPTKLIAGFLGVLIKKIVKDIDIVPTSENKC